MTPRARTGVIRPLLGVVVSAVFVLLTLSRVDLGEVAVAFGSVAPGWIAAAILVVGLELALRGLRWQRLLRPIAPVPIRLSVAYLSIGYFANSMLPARLGDLARALLAARAFGIGRLPVLGTIVVERLSDGLFIVAVVASLGLILAGAETMAANALWVGGIVLAVGGALVVLIAFVRRPGGGRIRVTLHQLIERGLVGATVVRSPAGFLQIGLLTAAAFLAAVISFNFVATSAGLALSPAESALVMGALALSTSIPAGPGSIGTYEFVGLSVLVALGVPAEVGLAVVVLVHLIATLPPALIGLLMAWHLHFRIPDITEIDATMADPEPGVGIGASTDA